MPFELKDGITLAISVAAFTISSLGYFQKRTESKQVLRKQLTDVLKELAELNLKVASFQALEKKDGYPSNYTGLISDQRRFFVRQAAGLSDVLGDRMVSPHEKNLIAGTFDNMDYVEEAARFFKSAAENSSGIDRGLALRNYGRFLYNQGLFADGEKQFNDSIAAFAGSDDRNCYYRCTTYQRWAEIEFNRRSVERAKQLLDLAKTETEIFKNTRRKESEQKQIDSLMAALTGK
jgi:hypothetical protein